MSKLPADEQEEKKAQALALVAGGHSEREAAREAGVPRSTLKRWLDKHGPDLRPVVRPENATLMTVKEQLDAKLFNLILVGLDAQEAQLRLFGDREWLEKQSAGELAVLHGVGNDKLVRLLAAVLVDPSSKERPDGAQS